MRTTFTLDDDVAVEVERLRRDEGIGLSEAVNRLIRAGLAAPKKRAVYRHRGVEVGLKMDVTDIASVLEILDES